MDQRTEATLSRYVVSVTMCINMDILILVLYNTAIFCIVPIVPVSIVSTRMIKVIAFSGH